MQQLSVVHVSIVVLLTVCNIYTQYRSHPPELVYSDNAMDTIELGIGLIDAFIDHSFWAVGDGSGQLLFHYGNTVEFSQHRGSLIGKNFFGTIVSHKSADRFWKGGQGSLRKGVSHLLSGIRHSSGFIGNVYSISDSVLLGFVHIERSRKPMDNSVPDRLYAIGIAVSDNIGQSWRYCGDVIHPYYDKFNDTYEVEGSRSVGVFSNIGGVPYLVKDGHFYVYFNEWPDNKSRPYPAVARAAISSVINDALRGKVNHKIWKKFNALSGVNDWTESAITGKASALLPNEGFYEGHWDTHSDATFCTETSEFLLLATYLDYRAESPVYTLYLLSSFDALSWKKVFILDSSSAYYPGYPSFISETQRVSNDDHQVGSDFHVLYVRQPLRQDLTSGRSYVDPQNSDLYDIRIQVTAEARQ